MRQAVAWITDECPLSGHSEMQDETRVESLLFSALIHRDASAIASLTDGDAGLWARACNRARDTRCLPYLLRVLDEADAVAPVPIDPTVRRGWMLRALAIQAECLRMTRLLSEAGIRHVFLKGSHLAATVYPAAWLRPMRDIDLLVMSADLARVQALLRAHGGEIELYANKTYAAIDPEAKHITPLWSPERVIYVEVHRHAADTGAGLSPDGVARLDAALWQDAVEVPVGDGVVPVPGPEAMFLHLVVHGIYDHELNNGPLFVIDLIHLMERLPLDPERVVALAGELGIMPGLALTLSLLPQSTVGRAELLSALRAASATTELQALPRESAVALLFQDSTARTELRLAADLAETTPLSRLRLLAGKVFASRKTMTRLWRIEGHKTLPPANPVAFWIWFIGAGMRRMRRTGPATSGTRAHLMRLRALRNGQET